MGPPPPSAGDLEPEEDGLSEESPTRGPPTRVAVATTSCAAPGGAAARRSYPLVPALLVASRGGHTRADAAKTSGNGARTAEGRVGTAPSRYVSRYVVFARRSAFLKPTRRRRRLGVVGALPRRSRSRHDLFIRTRPVGRRAERRRLEGPVAVVGRGPARITGGGTRPRGAGATRSSRTAAERRRGVRRRGGDARTRRDGRDPKSARAVDGVALPHRRRRVVASHGPGKKRGGAGAGRRPGARQGVQSAN